MPSKRPKDKRRKVSGRRELLKNKAGAFYTRRRKDGTFKEHDERGKSLAADRRRKAKRRAPRGQGDRGDR